MKEILTTDVESASRDLRAPVNLRIRTRPRLEPDTAEWEHRAYSFVDGAWFHRYVGGADPSEMADYIRELDTRTESWVYLEFARDLGLQEADGMAATDAAGVLLAFRTLRERLRGRS